MANENKSTKNFGCLVIIIFVSGLLIIGYCSSNNKQTVSPNIAQNKTPEQKHKEDLQIRAIAGAMVLKKAMRNPESFKLEFVYITKNSFICYKFRSQNGFGGMNVERALTSDKMDNVIINGMNGFAQKWNKECNKEDNEDITEYVNLTI